jgi:hypothetical protein
MIVDLTDFQPIILKKEGTLYIVDSIRHKELVLTPEEWVRQAIIDYLVKIGFPASLMQVERGIAYPHRQKRPDVILYDREGKPFLLIECKAPYITLDERTLSQALAYNWVVQAPYFALTNGTTFWVYDVAEKRWIADLPAWER